MKRPPWLTLALSLFVLGVAHWELEPALEFDRTKIGRGELWRWLTGHFAHFGSSHLTWDLVTFLILGGISERISRRELAGVLLAAGFAVSLAVSAWQTQFVTYRGLSGLDSALFAFFVAQIGISGAQSRHRPSLIVATLALVAFLLKTGLEAATAAPVFVRPGTFAPVPLAHLVGASVGAGGALVGAVARAFVRHRRRMGTASGSPSPTTRAHCDRARLISDCSCAREMLASEPCSVSSSTIGR